jgi:hypothetical protein
MRTKLALDRAKNIFELALGAGGQIGAQNAGIIVPKKQPLAAWIPHRDKTAQMSP